ncbi:hypothetical protein B0I32_113155 [Nonomuraea fuscirosea]|uniref:DUF5666 domain-containing protein n=1 Tax=Nonomuraea fuscirosea TaxID=1291556 RepID=A0A2T0MU34_9ACTN|nr:hypothetical protein [Nonomuraea fuscirosea]PRX62202.1 hypothetical protein B0I32_113155 [Nonomuraea fuscirosea]
MSHLDSSPFPGDLREELAVRPVRGPSKLTMTLGAGVVLVAGILVGIQAQNLFGSAGAAAQLGAQQRFGGQPGAARQPDASRQPGGRQRMGGGGGGTAGTVEKVEGGNVYVRTTDGATVTVNTTDQTTVRISRPAKVADLRKGSTIVVRGQQGADGAVTADSISEGGQGFQRPQGGGPR